MVGKRKRIDEGRLRDFVLGSLSPEEALQVLDELERNPNISRKVEFEIGLMEYVQGSGRELFQGSPVGQRSRVSFVEGVLRWIAELAVKIPRVRPAVVLGGGIAFVVGALLVAFLARNPYAEWAAVESPEFDTQVRAAGREEIQLAYGAFHEGRWGEASGILERFIRAFPESELCGYAHYSAAAMGLSVARERVLLWHRYDYESVQRSLEHLDRVLEVSRNPWLLEESHWLKAKGLLAMERHEEALLELGIVVASGRRRAEEAKDLIVKLSE